MFVVFWTHSHKKNFKKFQQKILQKNTPNIDTEENKKKAKQIINQELKL